MRRLRYWPVGLLLGALAVNPAAHGGNPQAPPQYTWLTRSLPGPATTFVAVTATNAGPAAASLTVAVVEGAAETCRRALVVAPGGRPPIATQDACRIESTTFALTVVATSDGVVPAAFTCVSYDPSQPPGERPPPGCSWIPVPGDAWVVSGPDGTIPAWAAIAAAANSGAAKYKADALTRGVGSIEAKLESVSARVDGLAGAVPTMTTTVCAEGSVRADGLGAFQTYVSVFSDVAQTATIEYITNRGSWSHQVALQPLRRYTDDANAFLTGPGSALAGRGDVDTAVRVSAPAPVYAACETYFSRVIGAAGPVYGGSVQDGHPR